MAKKHGKQDVVGVVPLGPQKAVAVTTVSQKKALLVDIRHVLLSGPFQGPTKAGVRFHIQHLADVLGHLKTIQVQFGPTTMLPANGEGGETKGKEI